MTTGRADHVLAEALRAAEGGPPVVVATVIGTQGSVPRHVGTKMLVRPDGSTLGTIGGGRVEQAILQDALGVLARRTAETRSYELRDPERGDVGICGGSMTVYLEPHMAPHTVFVVGAGHVGRAVVDLAHWLGYRTVVVDDRAELVEPDAQPNADVRFAGTVAEALDHHPITEDTSIVVVTRSHELDAEIVPLLVDTPARYIGVMGSRRRWQATRQVIEEGDVDTAAVERIHNPIGLDIGAESVEEIAVSILSEVIAANARDEA